MVTRLIASWIVAIAGLLACPEGSCSEWRTAESVNFDIWCSGDTAPPSEIARHCESLYAKLRAKWLGNPRPTSGFPKCRVVFHPNRDSYLAAVGQAAGQTAGSTVFQTERGSVVSRRIDLRGDRPDYLTAALPHELTHVVLRERFVAGTLPPWADEGMAILADSEEKQSRHHHDLRDGLTLKTAFSLDELLAMRLYPPACRWGVFYGQSASIVQFLVRRGTPAQLVQFIEEANKSGYETALATTYDIHETAELEHLWRAQFLPPLGVNAQSRSASEANY